MSDNKYQKGISKYNTLNFRFDGDKYICPEGKELVFEKERYSEKDGYLKITTHYRCHGCKECPFMMECKKSDPERGILHSHKRSIYTEEYS